MVMTVFFLQPHSVFTCSCGMGAELRERDKGVKGSVQGYDCCLNWARRHRKTWEGRDGGQ